MSEALAMVGVEKTFRAGREGCAASVGVLRGVNLALMGGEAAIIVGVAGAGKTTLLRCAAGILRPDQGLVRWAAAPIGLRAIERPGYVDLQLYPRGVTVPRPALPILLVDSCDHWRADARAAATAQYPRTNMPVRLFR
jgi:energy-coupling factor transporter ATP-binding protein EcfA2